MPISAGDVVLTFTADMTQLDAAFNQVANETAAKIAPATTAAGGLGDAFRGAGVAAQGAGQSGADAGKSLADAWTLLPARIAPTNEALLKMSSVLGPHAAQITDVARAWNFAGSTMSNITHEMAVGQQGAVELGQTMNLAGETVRESMYQARGEIGLLGEAAGIGLPRHVRSFIAELPGVGAALSAAFQVTAVLFIIEAIAQATEKLSTWVAETFIFTEAQRALNGVLLDSNAAIVKYGKELDKLKEKYELIGATGSKRSEIEFQFITKDEEKVAAQMRDVQNDITAINRGWRDTSEILPVVNGFIRQMHEGMKEDDIKKKLLPSDADKEQIIGALSALYGQLMAEDKNFQQQQANTGKQYDVDRQHEAEIAAEKRRRLEEQVSKAIAKAHEDLNKELDKDFSDTSKMLQSRLDAEVKAALKDEAAIERLTKAQHELAQAQAGLKEAQLTAEFEKQEAKINQLAQFGIITEQEKAKRLKALYEQERQEAMAALNQLLAQEKAAIDGAQNKVNAAQGNPIFPKDQLHDLETNLAKAQTDYAKTLTNIANLDNRFQKRVDSLGKSFQHLGPILKKYEEELKATGKTSMAVGAMMGEAISLTMQAYAQGAESIGAALDKIVAAEIQAIASIAEKKGTAQLAEAFGSWPDFAAMSHHFAAATLWFALGGALSAASGALSGSGSSSSSAGASASSSASIDSGSSANHPAQQPVSTTNIAHLGNGGLVSTEMIAAIGHGREIVLPLDNETVIQAFRERIGANGPITVIVEGIPLHKLSRRMSSDQKKGKYRVHSTSTARTIRQY